MIVFFVLLEKLAIIMAGTFYFSKGQPGLTYVAPANVSRYVPFFGNGLGQLGYINHVPFILMMVTILLSVAIFVAIISPIYRRPVSVFNKWYSLGQSGLYASLLVTGIVLTSLFFMDNSAVTILKTLSLVLALLQIPSWALWFMSYCNQKHLLKLQQLHEDKVEIVTNREFVDKIFINVKKDHLNSRKITDNHFFDHGYWQQGNLASRKEYLRLKKRQSMFYNFKPWLIVLVICIPTVAQQLVYLSFSVVDRLMVVRFAPHAYNAGYVQTVDNLNLATQFSSTIQTTIFAFAILVAVPGGLLFAYAFARRDKNETSAVIGTGVNVGIITSVIVVGVGMLLLKPLINFQSSATSGGSDSTADQMAYNFSFVFLLGYPMELAGLMLINFMVSEGRTYSVLGITLCSAMFNALLNWILLSQTNLGIVASALANVLIWFITFTLAFLVIAFDRSSWIRLQKRHLKWNKNLVKRYYSFGTVNCLNVLGGGLSAIVIIHLASNLPVSPGDEGGSVSQPTNGLIQALSASAPWFNLMRAVPIGIIIGGRSILAYCYSAKLYSRMRKIIKIIFAVQLVWLIVYFLFLIGAGEYLIGLLIRDPQLPITLYTHFLWLISFGFIVLAFSNTIIMVFQVAGQVYKSIALSSFRTWLVHVPIYYLFWAATWSSGAAIQSAGYIFFIGTSVRNIITTIIAISFIFIFRGRISEILHDPDAESSAGFEIISFHQVALQYKYRIKNILNDSVAFTHQLKATTAQTVMR